MLERNVVTKPAFSQGVKSCSASDVHMYPWKDPYKSARVVDSVYDLAVGVLSLREKQHRSLLIICSVTNIQRLREDYAMF